MTTPADPSTPGAPAGPAADGTEPDPVLEAVDVTVHYPVHRGGRGQVVHALENASLRLLPGRTVALVGESGSGKSTFARTLAMAQEPTSGRVLLHGSPVSVRGRRARRAYARRVQMVLQDPFGSLNPLHRVRYLLERPLRLHGALRDQDALDERLRGLLERVRLTPPERFLDSFPHELSGGQRQRIAIARALAVEPEVLLGDELVSMLDVSIRLEILNLLASLRDKERLAMLYITHDIAGARYFSDDIAVMYAGEMVEYGTSEEVTQTPAHPYTRLLLDSTPDPDRMRFLAESGPGADGPGADGPGADGPGADGPGADGPGADGPGADGPGAGSAALREPAGGVVAGPVVAGPGDGPSGERGHDFGEAPDLVRPPSGCRFHPRCPVARAECRTQPPPRVDMTGGHWARCWLLEGSGHPVGEAGKPQAERLIS